MLGRGSENLVRGITLEDQRTNGNAVESRRGLLQKVLDTVKNGALGARPASIVL